MGALYRLRIYKYMGVMQSYWKNIDLYSSAVCIVHSYSKEQIYTVLYV